MMKTSCALTGGKGNRGMFIERDPKVCPAGCPSKQPDRSITENFNQYSLQDEVDSLIRDSIQPPQKPRALPPLRRPIPLDMRHATSFSEGSLLINPPNKTKFQTIVEDLKDTSYASYWKKRVGGVPDPVPNLPEGLDIVGTTFGKKTPDHGRLYDVIMPTNPVPDRTPIAKSPSYQTNRNYCRPAYNPNQWRGMKTEADRSGRVMKCCLTEDRITLGINFKPKNSIEVGFLKANQSCLGQSLTPNDNIRSVPPGFAFGKLAPLDTQDNVPSCMTSCEIQQERNQFKKCIAHLNNLRRILKKRFDNSSFLKLKLQLKHYDNNKSGWLPKELVYKYCTSQYIYFESSLIEPLLATWDAYDGSHIDYEKFILIINHTQPSPELPKVWDIPEECVDFRTTYSEMVKPGQDPGYKFRAGIPSGRYTDMDFPVTPNYYCKADRAYFPEESDAYANLNPSLLTNFGVSHRDMFAKRTPEQIRRVFEAALKEKYSDEKFESIWQEAMNYHPNGLVCYETFRRAEKHIERKNTEALNL